MRDDEDGFLAAARREDPADALGDARRALDGLDAGSGLDLAAEDFLAGAAEREDLDAVGVDFRARFAGLASVVVVSVTTLERASTQERISSQISSLVGFS